MDNNIVLSARAEMVGQALLRAVLPSASLLKTLSDTSRYQVQRGLHELKEKEMVVVDEIGCLLPAVPVIRWTETGLQWCRGTDAEMSWVDPSAISYSLVYDVAKVEAVRSIAPLYANGGCALRRIHPYAASQPMFAVAEYWLPDLAVPAYIAFCWASIMDTQRDMHVRLAALCDAMQAQSDATAPLPAGMKRSQLWPAGVAIVAASEWGAARALCMASEVLDGWMDPKGITGWCYGPGGWQVSDGVSALTGAPLEARPQMLHPIGFMQPSTNPRKKGGYQVDRIIAKAVWAGRGGQKQLELLALVALFPTGALAHYQGLTGESRGGKDTTRRLRALVDLGLVEVVTESGRARRPRRLPKGIPVVLSARGQGGRRYALTKAGRVKFCGIHGGKQADLATRTRLGSLRAVVRDKVLLMLLKLSWSASLLSVPGLRVQDLRGLHELALQWKARKDLREATLVHILTLACTLQAHLAPGQIPRAGFTRAWMRRVWAEMEVGWIEDQWLYRHQDIIYDLLGQLRAANCSFAPGWMARTTVVIDQDIDPDAVVRVKTPWGLTWCYVEVELSDRTRSAVKPRCDKYGSRRRRDSLPVLIICQDDQAKANFLMASAFSESPPRILVTTLKMLKEGGFFGVDVWSDYTRRVTLSP